MTGEIQAPANFTPAQRAASWLAGSVREDIKLLTMTGIEQRSLGSPDRSVVAIPTVNVIFGGQ